MAVPSARRPCWRLAEYVGHYSVDVDVPGGGERQVVELAADGGGLRVTEFEADASEAAPVSELKQSGPVARLAFFRDDAVQVTTGDHTSLGADLVRNSSGRIRWFRWGARVAPRLD